METSTSRSTHMQMAINMVTSIGVFALNLCVTFFLTPFIVRKLGTAAYGFIGLSNNIIGYTALITVAVNSMAGRFITIKVHEKNFGEANRYMSSVFFTNMALAALIMVGFGLFAGFMPDLIRIPEGLVGDVRALFIMLGLSSCLGLMTGVFGISTFIRNRLDLSNMRSLGGTLIRVTLLLALFGFLVPRLWYFGMTALIMNIYVVASNYYFFRTLTPELRISTVSFSWAHLWEVTSAGAWNIISRLSDILNRGFDLLLANLFISARAMGLLSICQTIPVLILSFFGSITGNFAPELTRLYAVGDTDGLKKELLRSVRLCSSLSSLPVSVVFVYFDWFYDIWLPTENSQLLYHLTICVALSSMVSMPLEPLWNIFTITNKVKQSSLNLLCYGGATFITILLCMFVVDDDIIRLFILASTRSFYNILRCCTFLPRYGAKCLDFPKTVFYPSILRCVLNVGIIVCLSLLIKHYVLVNSSIVNLIVGCITTVIIGISCAWVTILNSDDKEFVRSKIKTKLPLQ